MTCQFSSILFFSNVLFKCLFVINFFPFTVWPDVLNPLSVHIDSLIFTYVWKRRTNARLLCTKKLFVSKRTRTIWNLILFVSSPEKLIKNEKSISGISHRQYLSSICTRRFLNNFIYLCLKEIRLKFYKSTNSISSSPLWSI